VFASTALATTLSITGLVISNGIYSQNSNTFASIAVNAGDLVAVRLIATATGAESVLLSASGFHGSIEFV